MRGFLRLILGDQATGTGVIKLRKNELLGALHISGTTAGAGWIIVRENNAAGREITRIYSDINNGMIMYGPFEHASKTIFWTVVGTAALAQLWAWHDDEERRSQF